MTALRSKKDFFHFFPVPDYLLLSNAGLAITDTSVRFVQFRRGLFGESLKLSRFEKVDLPEGVVQSGFINDPEKLGSILKSLSKRYGVDHVYATLPEERAYLFTALIDKVPVEGLRDAVAFIIEENVPVSLADSVFEFHVIQELKEHNKLEVAVSVLSKKVVDFYIQVLESSGLTPVSFDIESQAISRAVIPRGDKRTQLIMNLGYKKTGLYVIEDEVVQFTTTLPYGSQSSSLHASSDNLKAEMKKIFAFWGSRPMKGNGIERKIEKIILCGPGALEDGFINDFIGDIPVDFSYGNPWVNISSDLEKLPKKEISVEAMEYASAIGLVQPRTEKNYV